MQNSTRTALANKVGNSLQRLDRSDLVVHEHHRDEHSLLVERVAERVEVDDPTGIHADVSEPEPLPLEAVARGEHCLVLDRGGHDPVAEALLARRSSGSLHGEVVGLGAAVGEDDLARLATEVGRHRLARLFERGLRCPGHGVDARGVPERLGEERP